MHALVFCRVIYSLILLKRMVNLFVNHEKKLSSFNLISVKICLKMVEKLTYALFCSFF